MKIESLLNPFCGDRHGYRSSESPTSAFVPHSVAPPMSVPKRQKIPKDAPVFSEGNKTTGFVNYPPYEANGDEKLEAQHRKFHIYPLGEIFRKGVRHIPYNSDKKDFLEKTGRDAFKMFQYTYQVPGENKEYVVVWDYNVGLVRMTPFFKSLKYTKTVPAKALKENPGLKDISYSITGGALVCQGYWMPYQAAKAVAATFCYNIRWALTPVFGNDFPSMCIHPKDSSFARFVIDPSIVRECTDETDRFREEGECYQLTSPMPSPEIQTPKMQFIYPPWNLKDSKHQFPRTPEEESGYCTGSDRGDKYLFSPQVSPRSTTWRTVNRSESPSLSPFGPPIRRLPHHPQMLATPVPDNHYDARLRAKRTHSRVSLGDGDDEGDLGVSQTETLSLQSGIPSELEYYDDGIHTPKELEAASIILQLSTADRSIASPKRTRRGSRY